MRIPRACGILSYTVRMAVVCHQESPEGNMLPFWGLVVERFVNIRQRLRISIDWQGRDLLCSLKCSVNGGQSKGHRRTFLPQVAAAM